MRLRLSKSTMKLVNEVWEDRKNGTHAWKKYYDKYITIEPYSDEEEDFMIVGLVDEVDFLGYPLGEFIDYHIFYAKDFDPKEEVK